ncbi:MAG: Nif11-like leader peptide family RiPP precursor [Xenococcaceae cyanobacterium]
MNGNWSRKFRCVYPGVELLKSAQANSALKAKLDAAQSPDQVVDIGVAEGYEFTLEEVKELQAEMEGELTDEELELASGSVLDVDLWIGGKS